MLMGSRRQARTGGLLNGEFIPGAADVALSIEREEFDDIHREVLGKSCWEITYQPLLTLEVLPLQADWKQPANLGEITRVFEIDRMNDAEEALFWRRSLT